MSKEQDRERYQRLRDAGRCVKCGKPADGMVMCPPCREKQNAYHRKENVWPERYEQMAEQRRQWQSANRDKYLHNQKNHRDKLRAEALAHYGNGTCACCGESGQEFLCLDHINGDGGAFRKANFGGRQQAGTTFYRYLRTQGYPTDLHLQVLCYNCNAAKHIYGSCPHQRNQTDCKE